MKSRSSTNADVQKILAAIGNRVSFNYADEGVLDGELKDRVVVALGGGYYSVVDLLAFPDGEWIRFGFYRRIRRRLIWASRSAPTFRLDQWKELFFKASEKSWLKRLLKGAMKP